MWLNTETFGSDGRYDEIHYVVCFLEVAIMTYWCYLSGLR